MGGGGGGSGYVGGCVFGQTFTGHGRAPGNTIDIDYSSEIGHGGLQRNGVDVPVNHNGKPGFIVIYY
jgi:hypothetical protein